MLALRCAGLPLLFIYKGGKNAYFTTFLPAMT